MQGRVYQLLNLFDGSSRVYDANNLIGCLNRYNSGWVIPSSGKTWQAFNAETNTFDTVATNASEHFSGVLRSGEVVTRIDHTIRVFSKKGSLRTEIILPDSLGATSLFQVLYGRGFALSVANDHLFVMCDTNKIVEYDLKSGAAVSTIDAQFISPGSIDVSPSGNNVFVATQKGEIALYDVKKRLWVYKAYTPSILCSDPRFVNDTVVHVSSNGVDYTIDTRTWKWTPITMKSSNGPVGICGGGKAFYSGQHVLDTRDSTRPGWENHGNARH
jgi:DNA-binding beta-propeller fold protein YncE